MYDVMVVGGSFAGMSAALQLARGRRSVCVIDAGLRRNRMARFSHGVLGQDGVPPSEMAAQAKAQLLRYSNLTWRDGTVTSAARSNRVFSVQTEQTTLFAKRLILATGVTDELPAIPGLHERWGQSVFHCPYCHGYELNRGSLGVLATGEASLHQALLICEWGPTTFFTNGIVEPDSDQRQHLQARGVKLESEPVVAISGDHAMVHLEGGRQIALDGLFLASRTKMASPIAAQLGCMFSNGPLGAYIQTDETKETTVAGVFACGDAARASGNIIFAMADGAMAGLMVHRSLMFAEHMQPAPQAHGHHQHHGGHSGAFKGIAFWVQKLESPERDQQQQPDKVIANLGLHHGDVVADIGAGTGYFALRIAKAYPHVKVIAADAEPEMIDYLTNQARTRHLENLTPVLIDPTKPTLPTRANLVLLVDTLHHINDRIAYLNHLQSTLAANARIAIIDYRVEAPKGPPANHRISQQLLCDELEQAGFELEEELSFLSDQYFLLFKRRK